MLLGTVRENRDVIARSELKAATDDESTYEETSLTTQTPIRAFQEVDTLAKRQKTTLFKSKNVFIGIFDAGTASI